MTVVILKSTMIFHGQVLCFSPVNHSVHLLSVGLTVITNDNHICRKPYLSGNADFRFFSLSHVNYVDTVDEDILQAAPEIWCSGEVRQVLLYYSSHIQLRDRY